MKSEKVEVLSVPSNSSYYCIETTSIHACPANYPYKNSQYITFRKQGGIMERVYEIEEIIIFNPHDPDQLSRLNPKYKSRIRLYMHCREHELPFEIKITIEGFISYRKLIKLNLPISHICEKIAGDTVISHWLN